MYIKHKRFQQFIFFTLFRKWALMLFMLNFNYRFIVLIREPQINYRLWQISIMHRFFTMTHSLFIRKERWRKYLDWHFKKFTEHNYICVFWGVICIGERVMTLVDVKLSLASVSLCNWVLKLGLVLWVFTVVSVQKGS